MIKKFDQFIKELNAFELKKVIPLEEVENSFSKLKKYECSIVTHLNELYGWMIYINCINKENEDCVLREIDKIKHDLESNHDIKLSTKDMRKTKSSMYITIMIKPK